MKRTLMLLLCCLLLTACTQKNSTPTEPAPAPTTAQAETYVPETAPPTEVPTEPAPQTAAFTVYSANGNADGFVLTEIEVSEITESTVMEQLKEAEVLPAAVALNSFRSEERVLYLDFNAPFRDLIFTQGTAGERMLIGSVVNTFLSAYGAESVMITVDGEALESGHVVYDFPIEFME